MNINKIVVVAVVGILCLSAFNGKLSASPVVTSGPIDQGSFETGLSGSLWSFTWGSNYEMDFTQNGATSLVTVWPMEYQTPTTTWDISIAFGDGIITTSGSTAYGGGTFNWSFQSPIDPGLSVYGLVIGNQYRASNGESINTSAIRVNGLGLASSDYTATAGNIFGGLQINSALPITQLSFRIDEWTPNSWELSNQFGQSSLMTTVYAVSTVPEPSTIALVTLGGLAVFARLKSSRRKK